MTFLIDPFRFSSSPGGEPGGGGFGTHEYWRIDLTEGQNTSQVRYLGEVEMAETAGGADLCTGGTPIANTGTPANAYDGDFATDWLSGGSATGWIGYQFASPVDLAEVRLAGGGTLQNGPKYGTIQYSDDGVTWTTAWDLVMDYPLVDGLVASPELIGPEYDDAYRVWRLFVVDGNRPGFQPLITYVGLRAAPGGADLVPVGHPWNSGNGNGDGRIITNSGSSSSALVFDSDATNYWFPSVATNFWVGFVFPDPLVIEEVAVATPDASYNLAQSPKNMRLDYWDGTAWQTKFTFATETSWARNETRVLVPV